MVFQDNGLFPWLDALENAALRLNYRGYVRNDRRRLAADMLRRVGLAGYETRFPQELSGGMQQRVGIARAMLGDTKLVLMDEPFGALDSFSRLQIQELLVGLLIETPKPVVLVTHQVEEAVLLSDRIVVMSGRAPGRICRIIEVERSGPRNREFTKSRHFSELRDEIIDLILNQNADNKL